MSVQCSELDGADVLMIKGDMEVYKPDMHVIEHVALSISVRTNVHMSRKALLKRVLHHVFQVTSESMSMMWEEDSDEPEGSHLRSSLHIKCMMLTSVQSLTSIRCSLLTRVPFGPAFATSRH